MVNTSNNAADNGQSIDSNSRKSIGVEKRVRYFDGQYLNVDDFTDEQKYHIDRQRRPLQHLHVSGILSGLEVKSSGDFAIGLSPGSAIDAQGQQILLQTTALIKIGTEETAKDADNGLFTLNLKKLAPNQGTSSIFYYLVVSYDEVETDKQKEGGSDQFRRTHERPIVEVTESHTDQDILLAKLTISTSQVTIDSSDRRYSGLRFPTGDGSELTMRSQGGNQIVLQGNLSVTGNTGLGTASSSARLEVRGASDANAIALSVTNSSAQSLLSIRNDGNTGIGTAQPSSRLSVSGGVAIGKTYASTHQALESNLIIEGNLGIGTSTPKDKLSIQGGTLSIDRGSTNDPAVVLSSSSAGWGSGIVFNNTATNAKRYGIFSSSDGRLHVADWGSDDNRLVIDRNGNVGIGTSSPEAKLSVIATTNNANANNTAVFSAPNIGSNNSHIHWGNTGDWYIRSASSSGNVILQDTRGSVCIGTASPSTGAKLTVLGAIASSMWRVSQVYKNERGAINRENTTQSQSVPFATGGGTLLVLASGSGFSEGGGQIGMNVYINGDIVATASVYTNEAGSHKTFVSSTVVRNIAQGRYDIYLRSFPNTLTDHNDRFDLTILELPF